ncbi:MAG: hypothetical protein ABW221_18685 [Vicinamibacteria bacterium]
MRTLLSLVAAVSVLAAPLVFAADGAKGEWTGYITDTHCGVNGATKDHTAGCVEKCVKGGSKVELYVEGEKKSYPLNDFSKVKALVGQKVTVKGSQDRDTGLITVESASKAAS